MQGVGSQNRSNKENYWKLFPLYLTDYNFHHSK